MNKTLKPLFACLFSGLICTGAAAAEPQVINIKHRQDRRWCMSADSRTAKSMFHHFGGRIDDATPRNRNTRATAARDHGTDNLAYLDDGRPQLP